MEFDSANEAAVFGDAAPFEVTAESRPQGSEAKLTFQQTVSKSIRLKGIGLHTGQLANLHIHPAVEDTGICFLRSDLHNGARHIQARARNVTNTQLCTLLTNGQGGSISTIEHLMAALHALSVHNAIIEIDGPEIPIFDGSSRVFVEAITETGLQQNNVRARGLVVKQELVAKLGDAWAKLSPTSDKGLTLDVSIDFDAKCIGQQSAQLELSADGFAASMAAARTFGFREQLETLQSQGRALGGSMDTAIVIADQCVQNPEGLRFANEFARHKLLDAVGDLYIEGLPVFGAFQGHKCGHGVINQLMRNLIDQPKSFEIVEI